MNKEEMKALMGRWQNPFAQSAVERAWHDDMVKRRREQMAEIIEEALAEVMGTLPDGFKVEWPE